MKFKFDSGPALVRLRSLVFWCHLAAGLGAGILILVLSVTGLLLAYERQVVAWAERDQRRVTVEPGRARLGVEEILARVSLARPEANPTGLTLRADPGASAAVALGRDGLLYVDPYTGSVRGGGSSAVRGFFRGVEDWHRGLGRSGESRAGARALTDAANLVFLFLVVSGPCLWWPRNWSRPALRGVTWFKAGLSGRARDFNWHNTLGIWSVIPLFVVVLSGVILSYPSLTASGAPQQGVPAGRRSEGKSVAPPGLDALWARAETRVPGWRSIGVRFPASRDAPVVFTIDRGGDGTRPDLRSQLTLDPVTGAVVSFEPGSSLPAGRRVRAWARWTHTGEAGGIAGQTLAALASGGAAVLVWTGLALVWRRWRAFVAKPVASDPE